MQISYKMFKNLTISPDFLRSAKLEPLGTSGLGSAIFCCYQGYQSSTKTMSNTHPFNGPFAGNTQVSQYQKGKTNLDFSEARDSEWQWHQLGHTQVCTSVQADNHASTPPLSFLQAGCPSCRPTNSVKALMARNNEQSNLKLDQHTSARIRSSISWVLDHCMWRNVVQQTAALMSQ